MRFAMPTHFLSREKPVLHAVNGVDAVVRQGEAFCVVGESGCGKTTLGRIIMGLLTPSAGEVHFDGTRIDDLNETRRRPFRARMQMVFQDPLASLDPRQTVGGILLEPLPIEGSGRVVMIDRETPAGHIISVSIPTFQDWRDQNRVFEHTGAFRWASANLTGDGEAEQLLSSQVTSGFFGALGRRPVHVVGAANRASVLAGRLLPRALVRSAARNAVRRFVKKG